MMFANDVALCVVNLLLSIPHGIDIFLSGQGFYFNRRFDHRKQEILNEDDASVFMVLLRLICEFGIKNDETERDFEVAEK
jgi:hypothetical protein